VTETDLSGSVQNTYIFFNGQRVARDDSAGAVHCYFSDHLGSHGVVVNATGTTLDQDIDYYPYGGEEHDYSPNVAQNYKFTGKERDAESGLDNFGARYDASSLGRFMTPDWAAKATAVPYAKFGDPQTLNLYAYVENAPLNRIDADGHFGDVRGGDCDGSDSAASGDSNPTGCSRGNGSPCPAAAQSANQQAQGANAVPLTLPTITDPLDLGKIVTVALDAVASAVTSTTVAVAAGVGYLV
jgi:RHS repeat-associated protein